MSSAAGRARLASELSRTRGGGGSRASSPFDSGEQYATATSFKSDLSLNFIHSTPQQELSDQHAIPLHYHQQPSVYDHGTEGSAEMSIELGRGVKRGAQAVNDDMSSNAIFSFGEEHSQYEITGTPPTRSRPSLRRSDGGLGKESSIRRATESARATDALSNSALDRKQRAASENLPRTGTERDNEAAQLTTTFTIRGSRFAGARHVSSSYNVPTRFSTDGGLESGPKSTQRSTGANATVQSTTYTTNHSFMLPDLPNITQIVSGGTPTVKRTTASRSRFVSASYGPHAETHIPINGVSVPEDERAIFASLDMLRDRVHQLEQEKSEAQKHIEEYEEQVVELQAQLALQPTRANSGLGSKVDTAGQRLFQNEKARLQAKDKASEQRLQRAERKASVTEITITRVTKERDHLIQQLAAAYFTGEELERENEEFRDVIAGLQAENDQLKSSVQLLKDENNLHESGAAESTRTKSRQTSRTRNTSATRSSSRHRASNRDDQNEVEIGDPAVYAREESKSASRNAVKEGRSRQRRDDLDEAALQELASLVEEQIRKHRETAISKAREAGNGNRINVRAQTKSRRRSSNLEDRLTETSHDRRASTATERAIDETRYGMTQTTSRNVQQFGDDLTQLSDIDPVDVASLRRKLEEELRAKHLGQDETTRARSERDLTTRSITRKSSLKDITARASGDTGRLSLGEGTLDDLLKATKTVRVQSPHTSDEISHLDHRTEADEASILSNISRRRRRTESTEGLTSAFIIPDITLQSNYSLPVIGRDACIQHNVASCTACPQSSRNVDIPMPVPVNEREGYLDMTNATIRPSQPPSVALATVIKHLQDEIIHLKLKRDAENTVYNQHDPALSRRKRLQVKATIDILTAQIEKRSDQVYALYDVLEGQRNQTAAKDGRDINDQEIEETIDSLDVDPVELSGRVGRKAPAGLNDIDDLTGESDLPFEGFSENESEL